MAYTTTITDILNQWATLGVFAYVLPFLMIFAVVYGILAKTGLLGGNRGVDATIALAIGLLALQFDYVTNFFAIIFPMAGIGLAILLVALILLGLMYKENDDVFKWTFFVVGALIFLAILFTSLGEFGWWGGWAYEWGVAWPAILAGLIILLLMAWVVFSGGGSQGG